MRFKKMKLGQLCTIEKGAIGILKAIPGEYPMVVTSEERKSHNEFQFDDEAVIIPLVSSTGHGHKSLKRIHYQKGKFAVGSILCAVIPKNKEILSAEYLYRFLDLNKEAELVGRMKGMANVTLPMKEIAEIEIPLPSLKEQHDFVEKYQHLEMQSADLTTELTHQLDLVKKLRQQFLQEAVQGVLIKNTEGVGETGAELLKRIKAEKAKTGKKEKPLLPISKDEIPFDIPDNWVWCRLGEVELFSDYGTSQKADLNTDDIPVLRMGNIQNSKVILENLKYVKSTIDDLPKLYLKKGDLLFNRTNSFELVGKSGIFEGNDDTFTFASYLIRIKFTNLISSEYINFWINSKMCRITQIEPNTIQQNGQANFNGTKLKNILIPLPPLSIQAKIVTKLEQLMGLCTALEGQIQASQVQNEQLLQQVLREALAG